MKVMSKFTFKYFESEELPELFSTLKRVFGKADVPFYLIGARARDVWFLPEKQIRITKDVDWIIATEEKAIFQEIMQQLIKNEGFTRTENQFTLLGPKGMQVDFSPFFEALDGLKEVFERGTEGVIFDDNSTYQVATIPAIVLLKFLAWDDRPEHRLKDLRDIALILDNYFNTISEDIYANHNDLFGENVELEDIAAHVVGRKIKIIIGNSEDLKQRIMGILTFKKSNIAMRLVAGTQKSEATAQRILENLLAGIVENT